ncbi:MAG: phosphatidylserine decarboxylase family protein [Deltaproteobacteria bacterium]|nr:MAG: phosphatidylserine decarboxylase family protein [Deltaproteobacteria bacterium]
MNPTTYPIAKEGFIFIIPLLALTLFFLLIGYLILGIVFLFLFLFSLFFFRNPKRNPPKDEKAIVSPADGKVIEISSIYEEKFLKKDVIKISIFMNLFNVHINRAPITAKVENIKYTPGKFLPANSRDSSIKNEKNTLLMATQIGFQFLLVQIAGIIARRIVCYAKKGENLLKGEIVGMIRFGSRVDLYIPKDICEISVKIGEKVKAGETILGYLNEV